MSVEISVGDYITQFLFEKGIRKVFAISGASNLRIIDSLHRHPEMDYICTHHEQAGVMAAMAMAKLTGLPGIMTVTAGPGGTNALTGVASAFLDSVPVIVLAGQEKSEYLQNSLRGKGVQGLDMVSISKPITKYSTTLTQSGDVPEILEKAFDIATSGRPGPVWLDFPQDVLSQKIKIPPRKSLNSKKDFPNLEKEALQTIKLLKNSQRPLFWIGQGVRISGAKEIFIDLLNRLRVPTLCAWNAADLLPDSHELYAGRAGTYGNRCGNFAVQNCDLVIALGTRLAIPQIGYDHQQFARAAKKVIVEIDPSELEKFQFPIEMKIQADVGDFIDTLLNIALRENQNITFKAWSEQCQSWREKFPPVTPENRVVLKNEVNSYHFIDRLSDLLPGNAHIVTDMGTSLTCTHAAIRIKGQQRLITSTGLGEMGFGLPGAIGVAIGNQGKNPTVFIGAEGSLQMNIQEFQTVKHHQLPLKIFILNNNSYLTIKHTERALFGERLSACSPDSGVSFPNMEKIAHAYEIPYIKIDDASTLDEKIQAALGAPGLVLCDVIMPTDQFLGPKVAVKVKTDGTLFSPPLEDLFPFLPREEFRTNMLIPPIEEY